MMIVKQKIISNKYLLIICVFLTILIVYLSRCANEIINNEDNKTLFIRDGGDYALVSIGKNFINAPRTVAQRLPADSFKEKGIEAKSVEIITTKDFPDLCASTNVCEMFTFIKINEHPNFSSSDSLIINNNLSKYHEDNEKIVYQAVTSRGVENYERWQRVYLYKDLSISGSEGMYDYVFCRGGKEDSICFASFELGESLFINYAFGLSNINRVRDMNQLIVAISTRVKFSNQKIME